MDKKKEITSMLIDIFDRINIDTPSNFDDILEFVYDDVNETADPEAPQTRHQRILIRIPDYRPESGGGRSTRDP